MVRTFSGDRAGPVCFVARAQWLEGSAFMHECLVRDRRYKKAGALEAGQRGERVASVCRCDRLVHRVSSKMSGSALLARRQAGELWLVARIKRHHTDARAIHIVQAGEVEHDRARPTAVARV